MVGDCSAAGRIVGSLLDQLEDVTGRRIGSLPDQLEPTGRQAGRQADRLCAAAACLRLGGSHCASDELLLYVLTF
jgi:hypothetical protein